jgi:hypothetical protein
MTCANFNEETRAFVIRYATGTINWGQSVYWCRSLGTPMFDMVEPTDNRTKHMLTYMGIAPLSKLSAMNPALSAGGVAASGNRMTRSRTGRARPR